MTTATSEKRVPTATQDDYGQALAEGEITRILKSVQAAQFKKSQTLTALEDKDFKPRSLVEIAFAAEQKRQQAKDSARQKQVDQQSAQAEGADSVSEKSDDAGFVVPDNETVLPAEKEQDRSQKDESATLTPNKAPEEVMQAEQQAEDTVLQKRAEEDQAIRLAAEEDGYKRGFEAGLEAARTAEPTEEEVALLAEKEQERQTIVTQFHEAIAALASPEALDSSALQSAINQAVIELASERAGEVISKNPEGILERIRSLIDSIKAAADQVEIFMNPNDLVSLESWLQDKVAPSGWRFDADPHMLSGDIRLKVGGLEVADQLNKLSDKQANILEKNSVKSDDHFEEDDPDEELGEEIEKSSRVENATVSARPPYIPEASEELKEEIHDLSEDSEKGSPNEGGKK